MQRGKPGAASEFGRQVLLAEVEAGFVTRFPVLSDEESECHQGLPAIQHHRAVFGRSPWVVTGDRRLHTKGLEDAAQRLGVTHVVVPRLGRLSAARQAQEREQRGHLQRSGLCGRGSTPAARWSAAYVWMLTRWDRRNQDERAI